MKTRVVEVECDGCRQISDKGSDLDKLRLVLGRAGWLTRLTGDFDLCPECVILRVGTQVPRKLL